ncbi:MAG: hypothetical protein WCY11_14680 [Novosphingobium sp.]
MIRTVPRFAMLAVVLPSALSLAACKGEQAPAGKGVATSEVLEGSASDAMLPLDTVRSQPPLAPQTAADADASGKPEATAKASATPSPAEAAPQPAAAASEALPRPVSSPAE